MKTSILAVVVCVLAGTAMPAQADDDDRRGRYEREYRDHDRRHDYGHDHRRRDEWRHGRHGDRYNRYGRYDRRYAYPPVRHVVGGRYCDDHRHFRRAHYHVPVREYYRYGYPRDRYQLHHRDSFDATLIVTIPLF